MFRFTPLASGSQGNALLLEHGDFKLLIDVGITLKKLEERLAQVSVSLEQLSAVLITHEHFDHVSGLKALTQAFDLPCLMNTETARGIWKDLHILPKLKIFRTDEKFSYEGINFLPFAVPHDTLDPIQVRIETPTVKMAICTDLGIVTSSVVRAIRDLDLLYIEANHEPSMVHASSRPMSYKERVLGRLGHLSNEAAGKTLAKVMPREMVYLAHLSQECNQPELALKKVKEHFSSVPIEIAYQDCVSKKYEKGGL